jgi:hypothetical protein
MTATSFIHLLPADFADRCILASAFVMFCWLVEMLSKK